MASGKPFPLLEPFPVKPIMLILLCKLSHGPYIGFNILYKTALSTRNKMEPLFSFKLLITTIRKVKRSREVLFVSIFNRAGRNDRR